MNESHEPKIEHHKSLLEYFKHLTTLSTGSIVLLSAFLEKLFSQPDWKFLVGVSFVGFVSSVLASVIAWTFYLIDYPGINFKKPSWYRFWGGLSLITCWLGFLVGVIALTVFALRNLFR